MHILVQDVLNLVATIMIIIILYQILSLLLLWHFMKYENDNKTNNGHAWEPYIIIRIHHYYYQIPPLFHLR